MTEPWTSKSKATIAAHQMLRKMEPGVFVCLWRVNFLPGEKGHMLYYFQPLPEGEQPEVPATLDPQLPAPVLEIVRTIKPAAVAGGLEL